MLPTKPTTAAKVKIAVARFHATAKNLLRLFPRTGSARLLFFAVCRFTGGTFVASAFFFVGELRFLRVEPKLAFGVEVQPENFTAVLHEHWFLARLFRHFEANRDQRRRRV